MHASPHLRLLRLMDRPPVSTRERIDARSRRCCSASLRCQRNVVADELRAGAWRDLFAEPHRTAAAIEPVADFNARWRFEPSVKLLGWRRLLSTPQVIRSSTHPVPLPDEPAVAHTWRTLRRVGACSLRTSLGRAQGAGRVSEVACRVGACRGAWGRPCSHSLWPAHDVRCVAWRGPNTPALKFSFVLDG